MIEWTRKLEDEILHSNKVEGIRCLRNNRVQTEMKTTKYLQQKNRHLIKVFKESEEEINNGGMKSYLFVKENAD